MSSWKVILEHTSEAGRASKVEFGDLATPDENANELEWIAYSLAKALCAIEQAGVFVPAAGEKVKAAFCEAIDQNWNFSRNKPCK